MGVLDLSGSRCSRRGSGNHRLYHDALPEQEERQADEGDDAQGEESSETEEDLHADGEQDEQDKQSDSQSDADEGIENN